MMNALQQLYAAAADAEASRAHVSSPLESEQPRVVVLGLGNVLVGDDAFGPYVVRTLDARYRMPPGVDVLDVGTPGLDLAPHIAAARAAIVIDTVRGDGPPGSMSLHRKRDLLARGPQPRTNPHQPGLIDTLLLLELQNLAPEQVLLIGTVPQRYDTGARLSPAVRTAVEEAVLLTVSELGRLGCAPTPRRAQRVPDIWWERAPARAGSRCKNGCQCSTRPTPTRPGGHTCASTER